MGDDVSTGRVGGEPPSKARQPPNRRSGGSAGAAHLDAKEENKRATKKPKHLKRKLEQLDRLATEGGVGGSGGAKADSASDREGGGGGGDALEARRRALLQERERWEASKADYLRRRQGKRQRPKSGELPSSPSPSPRRGPPPPPPAPPRRRTDGSTQQGNPAPVVPGDHRERRIRPDPAVALPRGDGAVGAKGAAGTPTGDARAGAEPAADDGGSCGSDDAGSSDSQQQQHGRRQRGGGRKRRRGRRAEESGEGEPRRRSEAGAGAPGASREEQGGETAGDGEFAGTGPAAVATRTTGRTIPKSDRDDGGMADEKRRYCLGRRPVTDFAVGQECSGTVVYVKPFGVFLDVGCHSDAFCHVSRLDDSYVEDPGARFRPGDAVEAARVVEVDRARKRITVSLQSEGRVADERASIEARQERLRKRRKVSQQQQQHHHHGSAAKPSRPALGRPSNPPLPSSSRVLEPSSPSAPSRVVQKVVDPAASGAEGADAGPGHAPSGAREGEARTPHDLKRARKLERRAARRAQSDPPPSR